MPRVSLLAKLHVLDDYALDLNSSQALPNATINALTLNTPYQRNVAQAVSLVIITTLWLLVLTCGSHGAHSAH